MRPTILALNALPSLLKHPDGLLPAIPATRDPNFPDAFKRADHDFLLGLLEEAHVDALHFLAAAVPCLPENLLSRFRTGSALAALRAAIPYHPDVALPIATALIRPDPTAATALVAHHGLLPDLAPVLATHPDNTLTLLLASCTSRDAILAINKTTPLLNALLEINETEHAHLLCDLLVQLSSVYQVFDNLLTLGLTPCLIRLLRTNTDISTIHLLTRAIASPTRPPQPSLALGAGVADLLTMLLHTNRHNPNVIQPVIITLTTLLDIYPRSRHPICQASAPEAVHYALTEHSRHAGIVAGACNFLLRLTPRQLTDAQLTAPGLVRLLSSRGKIHPGGEAGVAIRELRSAVEAMDDEHAFIRASSRSGSGSFRMSFHKRARLKTRTSNGRRTRSDFGLGGVRERVSRKFSVPLPVDERYERFDEPMSLGRLQDDVGRVSYPRVVEKRGGIGKEAFVAPLREDILPTPIASFNFVDSFQTNREDSFSMSDSTSSLNGALDSTEGNIEGAGEMLAPMSMEKLRIERDNSAVGFGKDDSGSPCTNESEVGEPDFPEEMGESNLKGRRFGERERSGVSSRGSWGRPQWSIWGDDTLSETKSFSRVQLRGESGTLKKRSYH